MKKYYIEVTETLQRIVEVEANDLEEAITRVQTWADEGEGLSYEDFVERDFEDRTEFCEDRPLVIRDSFFKLPSLGDLKKVQQLIDSLYCDPSGASLSYDDALEEVRYFVSKHSEWGLTDVLVRQHKYPDGWVGPMLIIYDRNDTFKELGRVIVNKQNQIQLVQEKED